MTRPICFLLKAKQPTEAQIAAGNYPKDKLAYRGLTITLENKAGSVRSGVGPDGTPWKTKMVYDYGYVNGSMGVDGDQVDCYVGPDDGAENVYVVHQRKAGDWSKYDEDKVMIGFPSEAAAVAAFKKHYDDPRFLGPVTAMPFDEFKTKVLATKEKPSMIKSAVLFFKSLVPTHTRRLKSGKVVQVQAFENNRASRHSLSADEKSRQGSLFDELMGHAASVAQPAKEVPALLKPTDKIDVAKIEAVHEKRKLVEKRDMLNDFLETRPDSPNAEGWRKQVAEIDAQIGPKVVAKKEARKEPDMSGWSEHQKVAYALRKEYEGNLMYGSSKEIGEFKRKIRRVAKTIPENDEKAVFHIEHLINRIWGTGFDPKVAEVVFAPAAKQATSDDLEKYIKVAADSIEQLRKVDVLRVLESNGSRKKELANYIANKRPDLEKEVGECMVDELGIKDWKSGPAYTPLTNSDHPAPVPKMALSGMADDQRAKWIDLHRQQHEAQYKDLARVKKDLEGARSKRNKAETAYNEAAHEHGKAIQARAKGEPGGERAEEYAAWANRANDEYRKHRENVDRLSNSHAALVDRITGLGKEKEKLAPGSGDLRMDFAAMKLRSDAEEAEHAKWSAARYKAANPAKVVGVKAKADKGASLRSISAEYHQGIPIGKILDAVRKEGYEPVQEDGTPWEGMLTGADGRTSIDLKGSKKGLHVQWHKMGSGRYEVNAYLM